MKLLDTNVVLYAIGRPHRYQQPCRAILQEVAEGGADYLIDTELLQEILYVYVARDEGARGLRIFDRLLVLFPAPFGIGREEMVMARQILERHLALSPRDAIHAAVVLTQGLEGIVTTDKAFQSVGGLSVFDPATP